MDNFSADHSANEQVADPQTFTVGEREFTLETAATKIANADTHITTLESERQAQRDEILALKAQLAQSTKLDDALTKLQKPASSQESQTPQTQSVVSEEQIGEIANKQVEAILAKQRAEADNASLQAVAENTFKETEAALRNQYGSKLNEVMSTKASEMGISVADLVKVASQPSTAKLLLASMQVAVPSTEASPSSGAFNTGSIAHKAPEKFVDYSKGISSSSIVDALKKAGAGY